MSERYRPVATRISGPGESAVYRAERRSMGFQSLKYELEDGVARLTLSVLPTEELDRPDTWVRAHAGDDALR